MRPRARGPRPQSKSRSITSCRVPPASITSAQRGRTRRSWSGRRDPCARRSLVAWPVLGHPGPSDPLGHHSDGRHDRASVAERCKLAGAVACASRREHCPEVMLRFATRELMRRGGRPSELAITVARDHARKGCEFVRRQLVEAKPPDARQGSPEVDDTRCSFEALRGPTRGWKIGSSIPTIASGSAACRQYSGPLSAMPTSRVGV